MTDGERLLHDIGQKLSYLLHHSDAERGVAWLLDRWPSGARIPGLGVRLRRDGWMSSLP